MIAHSLLISIIIIILSYLYGKIAKRFVRVFDNCNCTAFGFFVMLAIFQVITFIGMFSNSSYVLYGKTLYGLLILPILLIIIFRVNILPDKEDLFSMVFGIIFTSVMFMISKQYNTNNTYYDSIYYLSRVTENSFKEHMGHVSPYNGLVLQRVDVLYDYQGYYYLWAMIIRKYREVMQIAYSTTPIYLWGASFVYFYILGSSISVLVRNFFRNKPKIYYLLILLLLIPYNVNYFNTILGFFGNSLRPVYVGLLLFCIYLYYKKRDKRVLYFTFLLNLGGIAISSSSLFIGLFSMLSLVIYMVYDNCKDFKDYEAALIGVIPLIFFASIVLGGWQYNLILISKLLLISIPILVIIVRGLICVNNEKLNEIILKICKLIFLLLLVGLIGLSMYFGFNFEFYFDLKSKNDMLLNITWFENKAELVRNIILYILLITSLFSKNKFKYIIFIAIIYFLNPLTCSAIVKLFTSEAYHRLFDIILNPFTIILLCSMFYGVCSKYKYVNISLMIIAATCSIFVGQSVLNSYSNLMIPQEVDYNYEYKTTDSLFDMYKYINENIKRSNEDRPLFLSQDFGLKGYVANIEVELSTLDYRLFLDMEYDESNIDQQLINYFYPFRVYSEDSPFGIVPDYDNIVKIIPEDVDYILVKTDIPLLKNGEYTYTWWPIRGCGEILYENDHWALLRVY